MNLKKIGKGIVKVIKLLFKLHDAGLISENQTIPTKDMKGKPK